MAAYPPVTEGETGDVSRLVQAEALVEQGRYDDACAQVHEALRSLTLDANKALAYAIRGDARLRACDPTKAERNATEALNAYDPSCLLALEVLAQSLFDLGHHARADEAAARAVAAAPTSDRAMLVRAAVALATGRSAQAQAEAERALAVKQSAKGLVLLAKALAAQGNVAGAQEQARKALQLSPGNPEATAILGEGRPPQGPPPPFCPPGLPPGPPPAMPGLPAAPPPGLPSAPPGVPAPGKQRRPPPPGAPMPGLPSMPPPTGLPQEPPKSPPPQFAPAEGAPPQAPPAAREVWTLNDATAVAPSIVTAFIGSAQANQFLSCNSRGKLLLTPKGNLCEKWAIVVGEEGMAPDQVKLLSYAQGVFMCASKDGLFVSAHDTEAANWRIDGMPSRIIHSQTGRQLGVMTAPSGEASPALFTPQESPFLLWNVVACAPAMYFRNVSKNRYLACVVNGEVHSSPLMLAGEKWEVEFQQDGSVYLSSVPQNRRLELHPDGSVCSLPARTTKWTIEKNGDGNIVITCASQRHQYLAMNDLGKVFLTQNFTPECLWVAEGAHALRELRPGTAFFKFGASYLAASGATVTLSTSPYAWSIVSSTANFTFQIRDAAQKTSLAIDAASGQATLVLSATATEWVFEDNNGTVVIRGSKHPSLAVGLLGPSAGIVPFPGCPWEVLYQ
eukprot:m51a1_g3406 hypothetical protein (676) ;mRNA; r:556892-559468